MNNSQILPNLWRLVFLALIQWLLLREISALLGPYFNIFVWPLFILFLPIKMGTPLLILLGFASGMLIDTMYVSQGLHASAGAFAGAIRPLILGAFEPKGGFSGKEPIASPVYFGWPWFLQVSSVYFLLYLFWFFSVDEFTFFYFGTITLKTLAALALTMVFSIALVSLFKPKN